MAADDGAPASAHDVARRRAGSRASTSRAEPLEREADEVQRGDRPAAHRVDVGQRVGRGDPAEVVRVVDDRREEVDRLHEREVVAQPVDAGVVGRGRADEQSGSSRCAEARGRSASRSRGPSLQPQPAPCASEVSGMVVTAGASLVGRPAPAQHAAVVGQPERHARGVEVLEQRLGVLARGAELVAQARDRDRALGAR